MDAREAILGRGLAEILQAKLGDAIVLLSQGADGSIAEDQYALVGVASSGDDLTADAARRYEETLRDFFGNGAPRFDLILLGLGEDGHTASLFPGTPALREKPHWVKNVFVEDQRMYRITLTAPLINEARHILFLVAGEKKAGILKTVLTAPRRPDRYPAQLIRPAQGEVSWYVDDKAASRLRDGLGTSGNK